MTEDEVREIVRDEYAAIQEEEANARQRSLRAAAVDVLRSSEGKRGLRGELYQDIYAAVRDGELDLHDEGACLAFAHDWPK